MVERFISDPIELPARDGEDHSRADLVFYDVDHSGASYEARVFINAPDADAGTPRDDPHYAGSFCIFGHGGCFGDTGHCDVPSEPRDPFDLRPRTSSSRPRRRSSSRRRSSGSSRRRTRR